MRHVWGRVEVHTGIWCGKLREREHLEDPDIDGMVILKWILNQDRGVDWID